ncbi:MAG: HAD family hydrolase [Prochlorothrix sp.]|nr:HAD family hydrolase [Prochlorothrix sp.]
MTSSAHPTDLVPSFLALDFDGVLCDGLREYFHSAWLAHGQFWPQPDLEDRSSWEEQFGRLRPVIETGWEMPVLIEAIVSGLDETLILNHWSTVVADLVQKQQLVPRELAQALDSLRDRQITTNLDQWLALHRFYPGVLDRLRSLEADGFPWVIITTKEGRFAHRLLQQAGLEVPRDRIFGKEVQQPKAQTLDRLARTLPAPIGLWFVEDRLPTLQKVRQFQNRLAAAGETGVTREETATGVETGLGTEVKTGLKTGLGAATVTLFLADWGYNTPADRQHAHTDPTLHCLSLDQFTQPFSHWVGHTVGHTVGPLD